VCDVDVMCGRSPVGGDRLPAACVGRRWQRRPAGTNPQ